MPNLEGGGTHKVILSLAKMLGEKAHEVTLLLVMNGGEWKEAVPDNVNPINLGAKWLPEGYLKLIRALREIGPDVILSATGHLNLMVLSARPMLSNKPKIVVRESTNLSALFKDPGYSWNPFVMKMLFSGLYRSADTIVCQSDFMMHDLHANFRINRSRMVKIWNPVDIEKIQRQATVGDNPYKGSLGPNIVAAGRFTYAKNFKLLINVFKKFHESNPNSRLWILGDGPLRRSIEKQICDLGLTNEVILAGFQHNPFKWFHHADLFVLSSHYEGLPNVLLEALTCGCPVLTTDCPGGMREVMNLTGNSDRIMPSESLQIRLEHFQRMDTLKIWNLIRKHFGLSSVITQYENVILN